MAETRRVWRFRWWLRVLAVAVPLLMSVIAWRSDLLTGASALDLVALALLYVGLGLLAWAAFRSRVELADGKVRVVNPWGRAKTFHVSEVVGVRLGDWGLEFGLHQRPPVMAFAAQCAPGFRGAVPTWVEISRAVAGRDPDRAVSRYAGRTVSGLLNYLQLLVAVFLGIRCVWNFLDGEPVLGMWGVVAAVLGLFAFVCGLEKLRWTAW